MAQWDPAGERGAADVLRLCVDEEAAVARRPDP
jgi:hypothetical protein